MAALAQFRQEFANRYRMIEVTRMLLAQAMVLAEKHVLRGYDAVQLAGVLHLNARRLATQKSKPIFISADANLNVAAGSEGLIVDDPNNHP
jgi:predicted nucleic acid-binding protein